jgi:hypothetical protein
MHTIRLHGPWEYEALTRLAAQADASSAPDAAPLPPPGRLTIPADWSESLGADFRGRVRFTRFFHEPTGLDQGQGVFLAVERVAESGRAFLNGELLGEVLSAGGPFRFEVSGRLRLYNTLTIEVESIRQAGGLVGSVRLEIEEPAP